MEYRILGVSAQKFCDCCEKVNLKLTIVLSERINGKEVRKVKFGTTCAAQASGYKIWNGVSFPSRYNPQTIPALAKISQYAYERHTGEKVA